MANYLNNWTGSASILTWIFCAVMPCCAAEKPEDLYSSEFIFIGRYDKCETIGPPADYVRARYHPIDVIKGPSIIPDKLFIKYPVAKNSEGNLDPSSLPAKASKWIIFLRIGVPTLPSRTFETFNDAEGRVKYTREALEQVLDKLEQTSTDRFTKSIRRLLFSRIEHYSYDHSSADRLLPILYYARGTPIPADKNSEE